MAETVTLPGFVNAHRHTFQRALRGRAAGGDFWAWRELMLAEAAQQTPASVRTLYVDTYREMLSAGYSAVGEFHYLGLDEARAAVEAAGEAGLEIVLLLVAYARGGLPRMRQDSPADYLRQLESLRDDGIRVGLAPHSVRACTREWLEQFGRYAEAERLPYPRRQPREIEECLAEHGCRPIELLERTGCLGPNATVVHATHADGAGLDLLAQSGTTVCACPTTEADLADGFLPARGSSIGGFRCASGRTRTFASTRSKSCARWNALRGARRATAASSRPSGCSVWFRRRRSLAGARVMARHRGRPDASLASGRGAGRV